MSAAVARGTVSGRLFVALQRQVKNAVVVGFTLLVLLIVYGWCGGMVLANGGADSVEFDFDWTGVCDSEDLTKKDIRGLMLRAAPSFLWWALLDVCVIQLALPPKASLTPILHTLQKHVLDASNLLIVPCTTKIDKIGT